MLGNLILKEGVEISTRNLVSRLDDLMDFFLRQKVNKSTDTDSIKDAEALRILFESRKSFSQTLREVYGDEIDFDSDTPLDANSLEILIEQMRNVVNHHYNNKKDLFIIQSSEQGTSPLACSGKDLFQDSDITTRQMAFIEQIGSYLTEIYFDDSNIEESKVLSTLYLSLLSYTQIVVTILALSTLDDDKKNSILNNWIKIRDKIYLTKNEEEFLDRFQELTEDIDPTNLANKINDLLQRYFPKECATNDQKTQYRIVSIQYNDLHGVFAVSSNNFYFDVNKDDSLCPDDIFPGSGKLIHDRASLVGGIADVSVFNIHGQKVFWGDLEKEDIGVLRGTYYVLDSSNGYHSVPKYANPIKGVHSSSDSNRPYNAFDVERPRETLYINPEYIRIVAVCKIENGKEIRQPK